MEVLLVVHSPSVDVVDWEVVENAMIAGTAAGCLRFAF